MSEFFQDDPITVAALTQHQVHYSDMLAIVETYNLRRLGAAK